MKELLNKHLNLLYSQSHYYSKKYGVDFDEVKSKALAIFCEAVKRFRPQKALFSTFLCWKLKRLHQFCLELQGVVLLEDIFALEDQSNKLFYLLSFQEAVERLSQDGKATLNGILNYQFVQTSEKRKRLPNFYQFQKFTKKNWKWDSTRSRKSWEEVRDWWRETHQRICLV